MNAVSMQSSLSAIARHKLIEVPLHFYLSMIATFPLHELCFFCWMIMIRTRHPL